MANNSLRFYLLIGPFTSYLLAKCLSNFNFKFSKFLFLIPIPFLLFNLASFQEFSPLMHDGIVDAGIFMKNTSNSSIVSLWDHGYFWQYASEKPTLLDGGNFNYFKTFYEPLALLTDNEVNSKRLLELSCSYYSSDILFGEKLITDILKNHENYSCNFNDLYLIVDSHSFNSLNIMNNYYFDNVYSKNFSKSTNSIFSTKIINCNNYDCGKFLFDKTNKKVFLKLNSSQKELTTPFVFVEDGDITKLNYEKTLHPTLFLFKNNNEFFSFQIDNKVRNSTFIKLLTGQKVDGFELVYSSNSPEIIKIFRV